MIGSKIYSYESLSSTNTFAFQLAENGEEEGTVVACEQQSYGRGRGKRRWLSPKGKGILISIILRPKVSPAVCGRLSQLAAVAVGRAIHRITGLRTTFKWPNDLLLNNKKVCGILCEMSTKSEKLEFAIVGIGVNVNTMGKGLVRGATSLKMELGRSIKRPRLFKEILRSLEEEYILFKKNCERDEEETIDAISR